VSFAAITLCVASQRVFVIIVVFVIDSVRKHLDTPCVCASSEENIEGMVSYGIVAQCNPLSTVVRMYLRAIPAICAQRKG
jgi:hypothetical protein